MSGARRQPARKPRTATVARTDLPAGPESLAEEPGILIEIEFDGAEVPPPRRGQQGPVDGSIKSAIVRWLNEQV